MNQLDRIRRRFLPDPVTARLPSRHGGGFHAPSLFPLVLMAAMARSSRARRMRDSSDGKPAHDSEGGARSAGCAGNTAPRAAIPRSNNKPAAIVFRDTADSHRHDHRAHPDIPANVRWHPHILDPFDDDNNDRHQHCRPTPGTGNRVFPPTPDATTPHTGSNQPARMRLGIDQIGLERESARRTRAPAWDAVSARAGPGSAVPASPYSGPEPPRNARPRNPATARPGTPVRHKPPATAGNSTAAVPRTSG